MNRGASTNRRSEAGSHRAGAVTSVVTVIVAIDVFSQRVLANVTYRQPASHPKGRTIEPLLVTIPQAATMLALGRISIYQLIWTGEITPVHIERSVRISVEQLERFVLLKQASRA